MREILKILEGIEENTSELEKHFDELLGKRGIDEADSLVMEYRDVVAKAPDGRLTNEEISYYMNNFGHISYTLGASKARQGLSSDIVALHSKIEEAVAFTGAVSEDGRKLTREDKQALATLQTEGEKTLESLYDRVTEAVDQRMWSVNRILKTLETLASMNMSEAKLGRTQ